MTDLTLDEQLFLLSRDPGSGRDRTSAGIDTPLAGAVLIGLAAAEAITIVDDRVYAEKGATLPRAHLQAALDVIAAHDRPRRPKWWLARLPRTLGLQERVGLELVGRGVLRDDRGRFLGLTIKRFPDADPAPRAEIGARVAAVLTGADADPTTLILAGLCGPAGLVKTLVERADRRAADRRAKELVADVQVGGAVSTAVAAAQSAALAAIIVSVTAASGDGGGGGGDGGGGGGGT